MLLTLTEDELEVLAWYSEWEPEIHEADWKTRRQWPPGFRYMADLSCASGADLVNAFQMRCDGPMLGSEKPGASRSIARSLLIKLLSYRLLEGNISVARLTPRGRAALLLKGRPCPERFKSHCSEIFDNHSLLPVLGKSVRLSFLEKAMRGLPQKYRVKFGEPLPDDETTWNLLLAEHLEDGYDGAHTVVGTTACLTTSRTRNHALNGSLRTHSSMATFRVRDSELGVVMDLQMSFEQLASLLISQGHVPVTISHVKGPDGMSYSRPAPPPVSVTQRMKRRIQERSEDLMRRIHQMDALVDQTRMSKSAKQEMQKLLSILQRDIQGQGAFATQQAMEEVSAAAEGLMSILAETSHMSGVLSSLPGVSSPMLDEE